VRIITVKRSRREVEQSRKFSPGGQLGNADNRVTRVPRREL
jgi:hypothetical protein